MALALTSRSRIVFHVKLTQVINVLQGQGTLKQMSGISRSERLNERGTKILAVQR
jgi:hypothetical protein